MRLSFNNVIESGAISAYLLNSATMVVAGWLSSQELKIDKLSLTLKRFT
jgi:hypothetical protein